jgi:arylsulfatase A
LIEYFGDSFDENLRYRPGNRIEMFNLRDDLGETRDLAATDPDRAGKLRAQLRAWIESIPAIIPGENPHFDPAKMLEESRIKQP